MLDERSSSPAIAAAEPQMAVLGIGAIEQHGSHLPVGTDWILAAELARRVAAQLGALLVPTIPFSMSECHGRMPGTVWLKPATLAAVLRDVVTSLREQGIHKVVVINAHGGNFVLEPIIAQLNQSFPDLWVIMPDDSLPVDDSESSLFEAADQEVHAGEIETSALLYLNPKQVGAERADHVPSVGQEFLDYVVMDMISPEGVWGYSSYGDGVKGERIITWQVEAIVHFVRQAFEVLDQC